MKETVIAITMGDPAGIGPEIILKVFQRSQKPFQAHCVVVGDLHVLEQAQSYAGTSLLLHPVTRVEECVWAPGTLNVLDHHNVDMHFFRVGEISGMCGRAAYEYIETAAGMAMRGEVDAVATAPLHKESLRLGKVPFIGHTEIFGYLTGTPNPLTMFQVENLRVFFLSRHMSLTEACRYVTQDHIVRCARECVAALERLGIEDNTLAIAGLNPHCGEHGMFGSEEMLEIIPAVNRLKAEGYSVEGPISADSIFHLARQGRYAAVLSLYHDQGHIATKTLDFERTISITNGMPILRTSVDHGTAFDIAGKGLASDVSIAEAIRLAAEYAPRFVAGRDLVHNQREKGAV